MLMPKRTKHRKTFRLPYEGNAKGNITLHFGSYGLMAKEGAWITANQIEAARIAMTRYMKRGGKVWINIFPNLSLTKKPLETRQGKGKGNPEVWVAVVKKGKIMFEIDGVDEATAREALRLAMHKLPIKCKFVKKEVVIQVKTNELRNLTTEELTKKVTECKEELFNLRMQKATGMLEKPSRIKELRKTVARINTILNERVEG